MPRVSHSKIVVRVEHPESNQVENRRGGTVRNASVQWRPRFRRRPTTLHHLAQIAWEAQLPGQVHVPGAEAQAGQRTYRSVKRRCCSCGRGGMPSKTAQSLFYAGRRGSWASALTPTPADRRTNLSRRRVAPCSWGASCRLESGSPWRPPPTTRVRRVDTPEVECRSSGPAQWQLRIGLRAIDGPELCSAPCL